MIKVISFDIGGTLSEGEKDKYSLKDLAKVLNLDYDKVRNAYKKIYQKTNGNYQELLDKFIKELNIKKTIELDNFLKNKFNLKQGKISKDKIELIKQLKEEKYKIILFSNTSSLFNNKLPKELLKYIDEVFYSYEIGYTKNEKESYKIIEDKLNCNPDEFIHVGDNLKSDYYGPINNGWKAIFYGDIEDNNIESIKSLNKIYKYLK